MKKILFCLLIPFYFLAAQENQDVVKNKEASEHFSKAEQAYAENDFYVAIENYKQAAAVFSELRMKSGAARSLTGLGKSLFKLARYDAAYDEFNRSLSICQEINYKEGIASTKFNLGNLFLMKGNFKQSTLYFQEALDIHKSLNLVSEQAQDLVGIGKVLFQQADNTALNNFNQAIELLKNSNHPDYPIVLVDIGNFYYGLKRDDKALNFYLEASKDEKNLSRDMLAIVKSNIGAIYIKQQNYDNAFSILLEALSLNVLSSNFVGEANNLSNLGVAYYNNGIYDSAYYFFDQAFRLNEELGDEVNKTENLFLLAESCCRLEKFEEAKQFYYESIKSSEQLRNYVSGGSEEKQVYFAKRLNPYYSLIKLLIETQEIDSAFQVLEKSKSRSFLELLTESRSGIKEGLDSVSLAIEKNFMTELTKIYAEISNEPSYDFKQKLVTKRDSIQRKFNLFQEDLKIKSPKYANLVYPRSVEANQIKTKLLKPDEALLEFFFADKFTYIFVITNEGITARSLNASFSELRNKMELLLTKIDSKEKPDQLKDLSYQIYMMLFQTAEELFSSKKHLIIISDGILNNFPFNALVINDPNELPKKPTQFLINKYSIRYAQSATVLMNLIDAKKNRVYQSDLLAIGISDFSKNTKLKFNNLPEVKNEVNSIADFFSKSKEKIMFDDEATKENMLSALRNSKYKYIHFATHGESNMDSPQASFILLQPNDANSDGTLRMLEIFNLKLETDLAVLSACKTAKGKNIRGEGIIGLTRAILYAGASNVVVSMWSVPDKATSELMINFYQNISSGKSYYEALQAAQIAVMQNPVFAAPFNWAPFILIGY